MNYQQHYNRLIEKAKTRTKIVGYIEKHHIIPRCLGGDDSLANLVELTPEEHYVAHQLLVKLYPNHTGLLWSAIQMTGPISLRANNKMYGWLKKKYQMIAKNRVGNKNNSFGKPWYHDPKTEKNGKFLPLEVPEGWVLGRVPRKSCSLCNNVTSSKDSKYCDSCRLEKRLKKNVERNNQREKKLITLYQKGNSIHRSLQLMGYKRGNQGRLNSWANSVIKSIHPLK